MTATGDRMLPELPNTENDDDLVECVCCTERIDHYFAICTDSGWVCDDCMENMS